MRALMLAALASGCSFGMKTLDDSYKGTKAPECSDSPVTVILDGLGAGVAGAVLINSDRSTSDAIVIPALAAFVILGISGGYGEWEATKCSHAKEAWEVGTAAGTRGAGVDDEDDRPARKRKSAADPAIVAADTEPARAIVYGDKPLYCGGDGLCFLVESACGDVCAQRDVGACFNARTVLDDKHTTTCATTVKECEARREKAVADPDMAKVQGRCGVYRFRGPDSVGSGSASE